MKTCYVLTQWTQKQIMNKYFSFKMASNSNYKTIGIGGGEVLTQY